MNETFDLSQKFDRSLSAIDDLADEQVKAVIEDLEKCTLFINEVGLFSVNEEAKEIANKNVKFLLIPALLGAFTLKLRSHPRTEVLRIARVYFTDFIKRLNDYRLTEIKLKGDDEKEEEDVSLESMAIERNQRIAAYKEERKLSEEISVLKRQLEEKRLDADDELVREFYLKLIKRWALTAQSELEMIRREEKVLSLRDEEGKDKKKKTKEVQKMKPFIITRTQVEKKVFGAGYPSLATLSIDEFISSKIEEGTLAVAKNNLYEWSVNAEMKRTEDEKEELRLEKEAESEETEVMKAKREMDDWKDENPRGSGNRHNMG